jgi:hypothetical protein
MGSRRNAWLLGIAVVLAALRFVLMPWIHSQAESRERLQVLTQRLDRSVGVRQNRAAILRAAKELQAAAAEAESRFPAAPDAAAFRLDSQRQIGAIVAAAGLKMALFDWLLEGRLEGNSLSYGRVRFQAEGALKDLVRVDGELEGSLPFLAVREMQLALTTPAPAPNETRGTLTIVADLFYRPQTRK